jgi:DNA-binding beta-propeller fold protein YncE
VAAADGSLEPKLARLSASKNGRIARMSCFTPRVRRSQADLALQSNGPMTRKLARGLAFVVTAGMAVMAAARVASVKAAPPSAPLPLSLVADLPLPGGASRFDYQAIDADRRRLYIAHLGDSSLVAFDLDAQRVIQEVPGLPSVHGVLAAPEQHLVLATATAEKTIAIIDDQTLQVRSRVPAGAYPNGLAYDPASGRAFVSNNTGRGVAVVDIKNRRALPSIDIGGGAGNTQYDAESGHVLAAVHGSAVLVEIDPAASQIVRRIALHKVSTCHGLLVSSKMRLAFAACRGAIPLLVVVDLVTHQQTMSLPLPTDIDVLAFDPGLHRLYSAAETGIVAVFAVASAHSVTEIGRGFLGPNAHTVAVDPTTHRVYFPLDNLKGRPVLRVMTPSAPSH